MSPGAVITYSETIRQMWWSELELPRLRLPNDLEGENHSSNQPPTSLREHNIALYPWTTWPALQNPSLYFGS